VYVRCPDGADDWEFVADLTRYGLLVMPSTVFHEPGYFRIALNVGGEHLDDVAARLGAATHPVAAPTRRGPGPDGEQR
jgi:aspartate aminotransferase